MKYEEILKRAITLNQLELEFNQLQDLHAVRVEQPNPKENYFKCHLYIADGEKYRLVSVHCGNYGEIKRYMLNLHVIRETTTNGEA